MGQVRMVSVIVPVYNTKCYLSACLDSLLAQTLDPSRLEIIVVDDGSPDGAGELADAYAKDHAYLRVIHQANGGLSAARNAGIEAASGDWLGFVDSDDSVDPGMYEALTDCAERTGAKMIQTGRKELSEDGKLLPAIVETPKEEGYILSEEMLFKLLLHEGDASFCTKLIHRSLFDEEPKLRFPVGILNEDFLLLIRMLDRIDRLAVLPRQDYHVLYRSGSISRKAAGQEDYFPPVFTDIVKNADAAMDFVKEKHPGILPAARRFALAQRLDYLLHIPVSLMRKDNDFYREVVRYVRRNRGEIILNPYFTPRDRRNLLLLSIAPRTLRALHKKVKKL